MIIISIFVYLTFSAFIYFSFFNRIDFLKIIQYFFVITFSSNILIYALLSLLGAIDHPFLFLILEVIFCILISILVRKKKPIPLRAFLNAIKKIECRFKTSEFSLLCLIGLIIIGFFIVGITTPPNNLDSLDPTHLTNIFRSDWDSYSRNMAFYIRKIRKSLLSRTMVFSCNNCNLNLQNFPSIRLF